MFRIGIDVGSTYTKYCVMKEGNIISLTSERTPLKQKAYFQDKLESLTRQYDGATLSSC